MNYRLLTFFVFLIFLSCSKFDSEDELETNSNTFPFYDNLSEVNNFPRWSYQQIIKKFLMNQR